MNPVYRVMCILLALMLLVVAGISLFDRDATISEVQDRELMTFPKVTVSGLLNGNFLEELSVYYADTFPGREALLKGDGIVSKFFYLSDIKLEEAE
jgi:hypothetical protein